MQRNESRLGLSAHSAHACINTNKQWNAWKIEAKHLTVCVYGKNGWNSVGACIEH